MVKKLNMQNDDLRRIGAARLEEIVESRRKLLRYKFQTFTRKGSVSVMEPEWSQGDARDLVSLLMQKIEKLERELREFQPLPRDLAHGHGPDQWEMKSLIESDKLPMMSPPIQLAPTSPPQLKLLDPPFEPLDDPTLEQPGGVELRKRRRMAEQPEVELGKRRRSAESEDDSAVEKRSSDDSAGVSQDETIHPAVVQTPRPFSLTRDVAVNPDPHRPYNLIRGPEPDQWLIQLAPTVEKLLVEQLDDATVEQPAGEVELGKRRRSDSFLALPRPPRKRRCAGARGVIAKVLREEGGWWRCPCGAPRKVPTTRRVERLRCWECGRQMSQDKWETMN